MILRWTPESLEDLLEIRRVIAMRRPNAADHVIRRIKTSIKLLKKQPAMGRVGRIPNTREWVMSGLPFIVPYIVTEHRILILRVLHTARDWDLDTPEA
jgi:plasmid stabilization system protein ParE